MSATPGKNGAEKGKNGLAPKDTGRIAIRDFSAGYGKGSSGVRNVEMDIQPRTATAIIGPSGCGKSTLLRCLNRMHELIPGAWVSGKVQLDDSDLYGEGI